MAATAPVASMPAMAPMAGGSNMQEVLVNCVIKNLLETPMPMDGWCVPQRSQPLRPPCGRVGSLYGACALNHMSSKSTYRSRASCSYDSARTD